MTQLAEMTTPETLRCRAVVLSCVDYRFVEPLRHLLADRGLTDASRPTPRSHAIGPLR